MPSPRFIDTTDWIRFPGYRFLRPLVESFTGISAVNRLYRKTCRTDGDTAAFCADALADLGIHLHIDAPPAPTGPLVVLGNHPSGLIEALMLVRILEHLRPGSWKILSNRFVKATPEFGDHAIPLDPFGLENDPRFNTRGFAAALRHLRSGGAIGAFPAGRVAPANGSNGMPQDSPWSPHLIRLASLANARILIAAFPLSSGRLLRTLPPRHPRLRALFLSRETMRAQHRGSVTVTVFPAPPGNLTDPEVATLCHRLCHENLHQPAAASRPPVLASP